MHSPAPLPAGIAPVRIEELFQQMLARKCVEIAFVRDGVNYYRLTERGQKEAREIAQRLNLCAPLLN
jgi:DNA-binding PadR family transcriptional regulator